MNTKPLVSIVCLTYNEEQFVRDTFDNFLSQKTTFPFEVLVYDDASQDSTPDIIREYAAKYPDIFRVTLYEENNFKKGLGFYGLRVGFNEAAGKYIAYCEGDDYWCDDLKLQKQIDFLEAHPEYNVCAHETQIRNDYDSKENGILFSHTKVNIFLDRTKRQHYTFEDTLTGNIFHISSMMFRNSPIQWPEWICGVTALDMVLFMMLAEKGDIYRLNDVMSVYRHNVSSITSTQRQFGNQVAFNNKSIELVSQMDEYWTHKYHKQISYVIARYYMSNMFCYLSKSYRNYAMARKMAKKAFALNKYVFVKYFVIESIAKVKKHLNRVVK